MLQIQHRIYTLKSSLYLCLILIFICKGERVINIQDGSRGSFDKLITWNIKSYPDACVGDSLYRTIYVKFDHPISKILHRVTGFAKELRQCAPIIATVKTFSYCLNIYYSSEEPISAQAGFFSYSTRFSGLHPRIFES